MYRIEVRREVTSVDRILAGCMAISEFWMKQELNLSQNGSGFRERRTWQLSTWIFPGERRGEQQCSPRLLRFLVDTHCFQSSFEVHEAEAQAGLHGAKWYLAAFGDLSFGPFRKAPGAPSQGRIPGAFLRFLAAWRRCIIYATRLVPGACIKCII